MRDRVRYVLAAAMVLGSASRTAAEGKAALPAGAAKLVLASSQTGKTEEAPPTWRFVWREHPSLRAGDWLRIDFRARFQRDVRRSDAFIAEEEDIATDIARRRVGIEGRLGEIVDFQVEYEPVEGDSWRDVYVNYRQFAAVQLQAGKFKLPFGLEENVSTTNLDFVYRTRVSRQLAPGRDRGVMVHGRLLRNIVNYEVGVFERDGDNTRPRSASRVVGDRTTAFRIVADPFRASKSPLSDFQLGAAITQSDVAEGFPSIRGRTSLGAEFFESDIWVRGTRQRIGLEMRWRPGPFSIQSEYMRATHERRGQSVEDTDLPPFLADGWYVSGTWAVTGERKSGGLDTPRRAFLRGGVGAIELAARVEQLSFRSASNDDGPPSTSPRAAVIVGNSDRAATVGVNWYLNPWIKIQGNVIREMIEDPLQGPLPGRRSFWSRAVRLQFTI
jgi:phosphate-selective porin OprO and OprP